VFILKYKIKIDYDSITNKELSQTFENEVQNRMVTDGLNWLVKQSGSGKAKRK